MYSNYFNYIDTHKREIIDCLKELVKIPSIRQVAEENPPCYINAGGTYRQFLQNAVEIGTTLIWDGDIDLPQGHGSVHQPDEFINIKNVHVLHFLV